MYPQTISGAIASSAPMLAKMDYNGELNKNIYNEKVNCRIF
jgi:hypothetical protein